MIKNYKSFLNKVNEANVKNLIKRSDLKIGDDVMTHGTFEDVNLDHQVGKILKMEDYGKILIEFETPFSPKFHSGYNNVGKAKHCFYVPFDNIQTNDREEFEKIIKEVGEEKRNRAERLNAEYKEGDVIVGIGEIGQYKPLVKVDGEVGIVYYSNGNGGINQEDKNERNNKIYWVGFLDKFNANMTQDYEGLPRNRAGMNIDKIHMRKATPEEIEKYKDKLAVFQKDVEELKQVFTTGTVVIANGNTGGIDFNNNIGVVRDVREAGRGKKTYIVQFLTRFSDYLYDVDYLMGDNVGFALSKGFLKEATQAEKDQYKGQLKKLEDEIKEYNHDYKVNDYVVTHGNYDGIPLDGQIGTIQRIGGQKPRDTFNIKFISKFSNRLDRNNCHTLNRGCITPAKGVDVQELIRKLENKEILSFQVSPAMSMLLDRINIRIKSPFMMQSYFDVTNTNDSITYLPVDKYKRLEPNDDPYKSRLRQPTRAGKFFRMLNPDLSDKEVETLVNGYKSAYDICISGLSDKLKLVSGEDVRFWYNEKNYVQGGGDLNSSCMRYPEKGPEMQMFVDNPDVIQMLILTDENNKLLGRALIWRLAEPEGGTYMDYVYPRYEKDRELFQMYARKEGWLTAENGGYREHMICALNNPKRYTMGVDALDHFDTFQYIRNDGEGDYLTRNHGDKWKRKKPMPEPTEQKPLETEPIGKKVEDQPAKKDKGLRAYQEGDKVIYKKEKSKYNNKTATFYVTRADGKFIIIFDENNNKFAASPECIYPG